ncbi:hypothetical protein [Clostridium sp.]|uniref:hypothetical protein n=1 Tax=Clostridium sp. TaxID=1506 RepID=UPI001A590CC8|nr:hypothetical protein [Clostridium sp.]MBK5243096.1 hypothetical protein [Clostridium sp.]
MKEFSYKILKKRYIPMIFIIPFILIFILSLIIKYGTMFINTKELIIDVYSPIKIGEYLYYYFSIIGIELTALLSYALWLTSVKSIDLAETINDKEENRDKEKVRESALIVYYDLVSKISILKLLYSKNFLKDNVQETRKINVTSDWVKNIANLRNFLNGKELETLFNLYNSFLLIYELERSENDKNEEIKVLVERLSSKIFIPVLLEYLWMDFTGETEAILSSEYYLILRKIEATSNNDYNYYLTSENGENQVKQKNGSEKYIVERQIITN